MSTEHWIHDLLYRIRYCASREECEKELLKESINLTSLIPTATKDSLLGLVLQLAFKHPEIMTANSKEATTSLEPSLKRELEVITKHPSRLATVLNRLDRVLPKNKQYIHKNNVTKHQFTVISKALTVDNVPGLHRRVMFSNAHEPKNIVKLKNILFGKSVHTLDVSQYTGRRDIIESIYHEHYQLRENILIFNCGVLGLLLPYPYQIQNTGNTFNLGYQVAVLERRSVIYKYGSAFKGQPPVICFTHSSNLRRTPHQIWNVSKNPQKQYREQLILAANSLAVDTCYSNNGGTVSNNALLQTAYTTDKKQWFNWLCVINNPERISIIDGWGRFLKDYKTFSYLTLKDPPQTTTSVRFMRELLEICNMSYEDSLKMSYQKRRQEYKKANTPGRKFRTAFLIRAKSSKYQISEGILELHSILLNKNLTNKKRKKLLVTKFLKLVLKSLNLSKVPKPPTETRERLRAESICISTAHLSKVLDNLGEYRNVPLTQLLDTQNLETESSYYDIRQQLSMVCTIGTSTAEKVELLFLSDLLQLITSITNE
jgi:hypothetical protein